MGMLSGPHESICLKRKSYQIFVFNLSPVYQEIHSAETYNPENIVYYQEP
jgi:hypothetical protein